MGIEGPDAFSAQMVMPPPRRAALVLVTPDGGIVGNLPAVPVATPWWQDVAPVVAAVRERHGIGITIIRLLDSELDRPHGGRVTYLAEVARPVPAEPWGGTLDEQPLRLAYARPGGPAADLAWAESVLATRGLRLTGQPVQVRTWNLSSLWRMPVATQTVWLKVVPPFLAHEGALLARLAGEPLPSLLGHEGGRILMEEIAGDDLYDADTPLLLQMASSLVRLQRSWAGRPDDLLPLGLPDWRGPVLGAAIADVVERTTDALSSDDRATLAAFVNGLSARFAAVAECGLRDTLVHGDFHPGNFRGGGGHLTLLDWGDSGVGHPLLDMPAFLDRVPAGATAVVRAHWLRLWREAVPGADPARAAELLAPVSAARQAVIYRRFLDRIEPMERRYHDADPVEWLERAATLLRAGPTR